MEIRAYGSKALQLIYLRTVTTNLYKLIYFHVILHKVISSCAFLVSATLYTDPSRLRHDSVRNDGNDPLYTSR